MAIIRIITPTPGPTTSDRILELIHHNPQGMTITELEQQLNRPVSMLQICLKDLMAEKLIKKRKQGMQLIYYPVQQDSSYNTRENMNNCISSGSLERCLNRDEKLDL